MLYIDTKTWLPDDLLIKADKMTMANSLELRVPLLDHRVLEFAASLPARLQVKGLQPQIHIETSLGKTRPHRNPEKEKGRLSCSVRILDEGSFEGLAQWDPS